MLVFKQCTLSSRTSSCHSNSLAVALARTLCCSYCRLELSCSLAGRTAEVAVDCNNLECCCCNYHIGYMKAVGNPCCCSSESNLGFVEGKNHFGYSSAQEVQAAHKLVMD